MHFDDVNKLIGLLFTIVVNRTISNFLEKHWKCFISRYLKYCITCRGRCRMCMFACIFRIACCCCQSFWKFVHVKITVKIRSYLQFSSWPVWCDRHDTHAHSHQMKVTIDFYLDFGFCWNKTNNRQRRAYASNHMRARKYSRWRGKRSQVERKNEKRTSRRELSWIDFEFLLNNSVCCRCSLQWKFCRKVGQFTSHRIPTAPKISVEWLWLNEVSNM